MAEGGEAPKPTDQQLSKPEEVAKGKIPESSLGRGLKIIPERFSIKGTGSSSMTVEERLKEVANTPPEELLRPSQWRRDLLASQQGNKQAQPAPDQGKPNK